MKALAAFFLSLLSLAAIPQASAQPQNPKQFELIYRFTLNGQYLGNVTDTFKRDGAQYQLTSIARPEGNLALLLPMLTLTSEGEMQSRHFLPRRFNQSRTNAPDKTASAEFDWKQGTLTHVYKGKSKQLPLPSGTLDALVQLYSFTLMDSLPQQIELPVTNGRKLMDYRYEKQPAERIEAALGAFEAIEYRRIARPDENAISVWIAPSLNNLPLRVRVQEDTGVFEQQLVQISIK
jgi:hypothetical protein